jgi:5-methylcytosine-specific restriction endonuclease McrBC regulatory subunit McrC
MTIIGDKNEINFDSISNMRIEYSRDDLFHLVAYSHASKTKLNKTVLGSYFQIQDAQRNLRKIYEYSFNHQKVCKIS